MAGPDSSGPLYDMITFLFTGSAGFSVLSAPQVSPGHLHEIVDLESREPLMVPESLCQERTTVMTKQHVSLSKQ